MYDAEFAVFMVVALGLIAGGGVGLLIGFIMGKQEHEWAEMTRRNKMITVALVIACSAVAIAALAWRFLPGQGTSI